MRIGIISDVHGDIDALDKTLDQLRNVHHIDHILCAGDLVGRGPHPNRVVQRMREHKIISVKGNHDDWFYDSSSDNSIYLKGLPVDWRGEIDGVRIFMCHGKPGNNMWGMYRDHLSDTYLNMVLSSLKVDVLVTGHTHIPLYIRVESGCLVNPGSLYTFDSARATSSTYGVLETSSLQFDLYDTRTPEVAVAQIEYGG